jgi:anti-sigma B factor antagonist
MAVSASDSITTAVEHRDDITLLSVGGEVDMATAPVLEEVADRLVAENPKALIVDLTAVTFLASVGLRILATTHEKVSQSASYAVVASGPATARPIQLTRLDKLFSLYPTLDDALTGVRSDQLKG